MPAGAHGAVALDGEGNHAQAFSARSSEIRAASRLPVTVSWSAWWAIAVDKVLAPDEFMAKVVTTRSPCQSLANQLEVHDLFAVLEPGGLADTAGGFREPRDILTSRAARACRLAC